MLGTGQEANATAVHAAFRCLSAVCFFLGLECLLKRNWVCSQGDCFFPEEVFSNDTELLVFTLTHDGCAEAWGVMAAK